MGFHVRSTTGLRATQGGRKKEFQLLLPHASAGQLSAVGLWEAMGHRSGDGGAQSEVSGSAGAGSGVPGL